jgi:catechol 2,3-dioxygenase-like lactoylglutathione lyase family enzyme
VIGRLHHVIVDCPNPAALAAFYSELLGLPVTWQEDDFAVVSASDTTSGIGFQLAPDFQPPRWPDPARPQQMHFDVMVDDVQAAGPRVLALGARRLPGGDSHSPVYADPAGHPFCLIPRPRWAPPIGTLPIGAPLVETPPTEAPEGSSPSPAPTPPARGPSHRVCP